MGKPADEKIIYKALFFAKKKKHFHAQKRSNLKSPSQREGIFILISRKLTG